VSAAGSFVFVGFVALTLPAAAIALAQPAPSAAPTQPHAALSPFVPSPLPSNIATSSPLFANKAYFYRGEENDPKAHPIPPEVQIGFKRERVYCMDWSRKLRTTEADVWSYFVTTCSCYPQVIYDVIHRATPTPAATP
jgi:hypothetical protein